MRASGHTNSATILGSYRDVETGTRVMREIRRYGFQRAEALHRASSGDTTVIGELQPWVGSLLGAAVALILAAGYFLFFSYSSAGLASTPAELAILAVLVPLGGLLGWSISLRLDFGVNRRLTDRYRRWVLPEETLVIVQAPMERAQSVMALMRRVERGLPSIFVLRPAYHPPEVVIEVEQGARFTGERLKLHAAALAARQRVEPNPIGRGPGSRSLVSRAQQSLDIIGGINADLSEAARLGQSISTSAEWLLDNAYIVQRHVADVKTNLSRGFYEVLPILSEGPKRGYPRVYELASEYVAHSDSEVYEQELREFLEAYQEIAPLTIGELWAIPLMVRLALVERLSGLAIEVSKRQQEHEQADFWANRLLMAARRAPNQVLYLLSELAKEQPNAPAYFIDRLTSQLQGEAMALDPLRSWLERVWGAPMAEVIQQEQRRHAGYQVSIASTIGSLRLLSRIDWRETFEQVSVVEQILRTDPAGVYPLMDFDTRDQYRRAVEQIARHSDATEDEVAWWAIEASTPANEDPRQGHVGFHLAGGGRHQLEARAHYRTPAGQRLHRWATSHPALTYVGSVVAITAILMAVGLYIASRNPEAIAQPWAQMLLAALAIVPASEVAVALVNYLAALVLKPQPLMKMSFEKGIPDEWRTLVVVPVILHTPEEVREQMDQLEIRYLANADQNLHFALLADFPDANQPELPEDQALLSAAVLRMKELNGRHGGNRFSVFYRRRRWSESEGRWMGWERKRGKLEELNRWLMDRNHLLEGNGTGEEENIVHVGEPSQLVGIQFVITLDADTQLPTGTARKMVGTLAHPLNRPLLGADGRTVSEGYSIIQPRVSTLLPSATATRFSRTFTDPVGADPYSHVVSDVYQDLAHEGSYIGKGIYDLQMFHRVLGGRFPEATLLSHDLLEGAYARVGAATDIELYDSFPSSYVAYSSRQHRWTRGDWQIADWVTPRVPSPRGGREPNPLNAINRWKILDNLRRSLVPVLEIGTLVVGWLILPRSAPFWSLLVALALFLPALLQTVTWVVRQPGEALTSRQGWREAGNGWMRALLLTVFLPHQAALSLDAVLRVAYRRLISHRGLLEWQTFQATDRGAQERERDLMIRGILASAFAILLAALIVWREPAAFLAALPFLVLWAMFPAAVIWLRGGARLRPVETLSPRDRLFLRHVARQTWRYYDDFIGKRTNWLPPDNYQEALRVEVAERTSPTNIGLWLLATLAARDFGYLTLDQVVQRGLSTMATVDKLERYEGHLLNWYDTRTLEPLIPRYVSTVDSGNLLGSLWALAEGYQQMVEEPILDARAMEGLADTLSLVLQHERTATDFATGVDSARLSYLMAKLAGLLGDPPSILSEVISRIRAAAAPAAELSEVLQAGLTLPYFRPGQPFQPIPPGDPVAQATYWASQVERQIARWAEIIDRYLPWVEWLDRLSSEQLGELDPEAASLRQQLLAEAPSLRSLALGEHRPLEAFASLLQPTGEPAGVAQAWRQELLHTISVSRWLAGEMLAEAEGLIARTDRMGQEMNMRFLYDEERKLFSIGYNVTERRLDNSYYDLLASEARVASLVAIARGEVPAEHWLALGRPFGMAGGHRVLFSWSGTMFEYLMPILLTRRYENSLLDEACRQAVAWQMEYGHRRGVPWGISEAAFVALDNNRIYQYQAFGVPGLGLKRGLEEDLVVAPYASALALMVDPRASMDNLRRLDRAGLRGDYGYYDSIDYTRQRRAEGKEGIVAYTYMVHHQGMVLLSLDNLLHDNVIQERFHADPRVKAVESLLFERIPLAPLILEGSTRDAAPPRLRLAVAGDRASLHRFTSPNQPTPRTQLLGNESYSVMVTSAGGGYSRWRDFEISRWRADTTRDNWGAFHYVKDLDDGSLWASTYQPVRRPSSRYSASFPSNRAEFRRRDNEIGTETEITVSPEDDVEVRRITLVNYSDRVRRLEVTSYQELSLAPHNADRAHPAFSKMFIQTEALPGQNALLAWRKPRSPQDAPIWAVHTVVTSSQEGSEVEGAQFETDRASFIGRGRTLERPAAVDEELSGATGSVLDPIFSLRRQVSLQPGGRAHLVFITGAAESRDGALELLEKYYDTRAARRVFDLSSSQSQLMALHLRITAEDMMRFQQLSSHMLFPNPRLRAARKRLLENRLGQSGLWPYGISGDLPIMVVSIDSAADLGPVREALMAHTFWRLRGFKSDLVLLDEEAGSYEQPLREELRRLIQSHAQYTGVDQPGGIFLRSADQMPSQDFTLILAAARVVLVASRGPLIQQLSATGEAPSSSPPLVATRGAEEEPSPPLPFMELPYFNGTGGFTPDGKEYAIYLGPGSHTPLPWVNVMANSRFGALVSESGPGFAWYGNSQSNRLLPWSNDPIVDPAGDAVYIRDEELGVVWTPTPAPIREVDAYRARHGQGYTLFEHNSHAIEQELLVFVPMDESEGLPVRVQRLRLRNRSSRRRVLTVTSYAELVLGGTREETQMHVVSNWDPDTAILTAQNRYHPDFAGRVAFASATPRPTGYTADRTAFLGRNGSLAHPAAMGYRFLSRRHGPGLDPCAVLQIQVELNPGQEAEVAFVLGEAANIDEARNIVQHFRDPVAVGQALDTTRAWWDRFLGAVEVDTPDLAVNFLLNRWLPYQALSCRLWGRSAFYQSGGALGFRDQLQDSMATVYSAPHLSRAQLLATAARQFLEGDVQHWWHPESGAGVRTRISDDLLWLPYVTAHYVRTTGDAAVLDEMVPFLKGKTLDEGEDELYYVPEVAAESDSLLEHCRRAIARGLTAGPHGLPLIGTGDWNDGLNHVGAEGKGESVWLAWFLIDVLNGFAELLEGRGEASMAEEYRDKARTLASTIEAQAWDGGWYRRAYFDDGTPLGSRSNAAARIDSLPQSWGVISGAGDPARLRQALEAVEEQLVREQDGMVLLFTPPFGSREAELALEEEASPPMPYPGYIAGYPPGVRENGGQYTHAAIWVALAYARLGDGDRANRILRMLNPVEHARTPGDVNRYKAEPYVVAADVYSLVNHVGRGGWTWYTGSAGWMYRVWLEEVLGLKLRADHLVIDPVIATAWNGFTLRYRHGSASYEAVVENPDHVSRGVARVEMDGRVLAGTKIPLRDDGALHRVVVRLGKPGISAG